MDFMNTKRHGRVLMENEHEKRRNEFIERFHERARDKGKDFAKEIVREMVDAVCMVCSSRTPPENKSLCSNCRRFVNKLSDEEYVAIALMCSEGYSGKDSISIRQDLRDWLKENKSKVLLELM